MVSNSIQTTLNSERLPPHQRFSGKEEDGLLHLPLGVNPNKPHCGTHRKMPPRKAVTERRKEYIKSSLMERHSISLVSHCLPTVWECFPLQWHLWSLPTFTFKSVPHSSFWRKLWYTVLYLTWRVHWELRGSQSRALAFNYLITWFLGLVWLVCGESLQNWS